MQVVLHFSAPIHVNTTLGSPYLFIVVDSANTTTTNNANTTDTGLRYAMHSSGLTQFVDIGVDASR